MRFLPISDDEEKAISRGSALDPDTMVLTKALFARLRPRHEVLAEQAGNALLASYDGAGAGAGALPASCFQ